MAPKKPSPHSPSLAALRLHSQTLSKLSTSNYKSALKYARRAQRVDPTLPHLPLIITALKVLRSPPLHHYEILLLPPLSSSTHVRSQFKTLSLTLNPDKNDFKFNGLDDAFNRLSDSYNFLSDRVKKKEFDEELRKKMEMFTTCCDACRDLCGFEKKYLNCKVKCPNCHKKFLAEEVKVEEEVALKSKKSNGWKSFLDDEDVSIGRLKSKRNTIRKRFFDEEDEFEENVRISSLKSKRPKVRKTLLDEDDDYVVEEDTIGRLVPKKSRYTNNLHDEDVDYEKEDTNSRSILNKSMPRKRLLDEDFDYEEEGDDNDDDDDDEDRYYASRNMVRNSFFDEENEEEEEEEDTYIRLRSLRKSMVGKEKTLAEMQLEILNARGKRKEKKKGRNERAIVSIEDEDEEEEEDLSLMKVVNSDFYDFSKDRSEKSFGKGQIWAVYNDDDGMPRHYGLIEDVRHLNSFKVKMCLLKVENKQGQDLLLFKKLSHYISCGTFRLECKVEIDSVNMFSHLVEFERAGKEIYRIYPKKGSVWALYKDRGLDGEDEEEGRDYDIVTCLTSYSEMYGLSVAHLEKVEGYKTIFKRREVGVHAITWLDKENTQLFSHQIPARKLLGKQDESLPGECWELDPASLTSELLCIDRGKKRLT